MEALEPLDPLCRCAWVSHCVGRSGGRREGGSYRALPKLEEGRERERERRRGRENDRGLVYFSKKFIKFFRFFVTSNL